MTYIESIFPPKTYSRVVLCVVMFFYLLLCYNGLWNMALYPTEVLTTETLQSFMDACLMFTPATLIAASFGVLSIWEFVCTVTDNEWKTAMEMYLWALLIVLVSSYLAYLISTGNNSGVGIWMILVITSVVNIIWSISIIILLQSSMRMREFAKKLGHEDDNNQNENKEVDGIVEMTLPAVFITKKPYSTEKPMEVKKETEYEKFSRLFLEALMTKNFSLVKDLLADNVIQILYDSKEFIGKNEVISYWEGWLERWNEPAENTKYEVKYCKYYNREVLSIQPLDSKNLYQMARIENGKVQQLVLCPNPLQSSMIRYWDLDHSPLLFKDLTVMPHRMGKDLEPRPYRIPCMRCGCKSEKLQLYEYTHDAGPLEYKGELSVCTNCMEAVEFLPTILIRYQ